MDSKEISLEALRKVEGYEDEKEWLEKKDMSEWELLKIRFLIDVKNYSLKEAVKWENCRDKVKMFDDIKDHYFQTHSNTYNASESDKIISKCLDPVKYRKYNNLTKYEGFLMQYIEPKKRGRK